MSSGSALFNWDKDFDLLMGRTKGEKVPIRILKKLIDEENEQVR